MTSQENIKPKSIRLSILTALATGGITTVDDLQTQLDQSRKTIVDNAIHAINDQLIERVRDDVTGMAAYQITPAGRKFLATHAKEKPEAEKKVAPIERKIAPAPAAVQKQPNPPPTEPRPSPPPPPPEKKATTEPSIVELIPEKTFTVKVNGTEFFGMKLVSSWEGLRKLEDSTGRWIIVMGTESPMVSAMSKSFDRILGREGSPEVVIPVTGSVAFKDAMEASEVTA